MIHYWHSSGSVKGRIYIPKYYDPSIKDELDTIKDSHHLLEIQRLVEDGVMAVGTGHEIGKLAYGTGDIPFVRTSDISNWEIKSAPKQGVSEEIYLEYADSQDVKTGDILLVRDGTYLIGTNCIITALDEKILYQSHILKFRVNDKGILDPYLLFLALNADIVQRQIRSIQFTADTIDTIGNRYLEMTIPIPKDAKKKHRLSKRIQALLDGRERGKAFIKHCPTLMEQTLSTNKLDAINDFMSKSWDEILSELKQETVTSEFGHFETFWLSSSSVKERIYLPKYYDPEIAEELHDLEITCECVSIGELVDNKILECTTGDEIGKMAYGTGEIPFIRTSDFANWEIKHDPKQGVSEEIYLQYSESEDVKPLDILLVRDGTYLVGTSCIITENDAKMLFCGGLYKIRVLNEEKLNPWLLLGLLNSYIVKRQIRTKQFTRDVIDTIGKRLLEVVVPIPKSSEVRNGITSKVKAVIQERIKARVNITQMASDMMES